MANRRHQSGLPISVWIPVEHDGSPCRYRTGSGYCDETLVARDSFTGLRLGRRMSTAGGAILQLWGRGPNAGRARERVAACHEARMGELVESIAATIDRYRAGDPFGRGVTWALTARYLEVD